MKNICVFLGAKSGIQSDYETKTIILAQEIAKKKLRLIYGGASIGLMGKLANTVIEFGSEVIGIITKKLMQEEIAHKNLTTLHVVNSMHKRKLMMSNISDAFIILPGGLGTLEETFEVWNAIKIGLHKKPVGILNINGYFNQLLSFLDKASKEGFVKKEQIDRVIIADCPIVLINKIYNLLHFNVKEI